MEAWEFRIFRHLMMRHQKTAKKWGKTSKKSSKIFKIGKVLKLSKGKKNGLSPCIYWVSQTIHLPSLRGFEPPAYRLGARKVFAHPRQTKL